MALRCSLLGHDYGDPEVEREREERGSEVVVTVQEFEECARCGDRNILSENTEVTSLSAATDADSLPPEPEPETAIPDSDAEAVEPPTGAADEVGTEVAFSDDGDDDFIDAEADEPAAAADESTDDFDVPTDENGDPVTDDGEILDDDDDDPVAADRERDHGEWPDSDDVGPPVGSENEPSGWPDSDEDGDREDDAPIDAELEDPVEPDEPVTDDAVVLEDDTGTVSGGRGESTAAADARSVTAEPPNASETQGSAAADAGPATGDESAEGGAASGSGIERAGSAPTPSQSDGPREDVPTEFYCPRCDFVSDGDRGSLRAGDICPDCRKGYLGERERR
ncbi:hypothetical protein HTZ84_19200 [Haloterrigena sp. SYSU A558-1]|uniref:Oxidoreductase n=1 Tax=Haloterrigena gelatinilytica TaxID=2741724 RepID=A0ABX2LDR4_9EURY|nr:hypothetical protein [Haloterrigena gelatinilytica]NUC74395.1 hypothetical protein [Haloterrigena gelatinilytica]